MAKWIAVLAIMAGLAAGAAYGQNDNSAIVRQNADLRAQLKKERQELRTLRRIAKPILKPTPAGNKALARAFFGTEYKAAAEIINGETAGTWDEQIWNGGRSGAWPENSNFDGQCDVREAYGLGQACERDKMLAYGSDAYTNPLTQMIWFKAYAKERYGSVTAAAAHWTPARSW
jgi:type II secretory pathway pseudopilin PulG